MYPQRQQVVSCNAQPEANSLPKQNKTKQIKTKQQSKKERNKQINKTKNEKNEIKDKMKKHYIMLERDAPSATAQNKNELMETKTGLFSEFLLTKMLKATRGKRRDGEQRYEGYLNLSNKTAEEARAFLLAVRQSDVRLLTHQHLSRDAVVERDLHSIVSLETSHAFIKEQR